MRLVRIIGGDGHLRGGKSCGYMMPIEREMKHFEVHTRWSRSIEIKSLASCPLRIRSTVNPSTKQAFVLQLTQKLKQSNLSGFNSFFLTWLTSRLPPVRTVDYASQIGSIRIAYPTFI
jgi:hypothetical protein